MKIKELFKKLISIVTIVITINLFCPKSVQAAGFFGITVNDLIAAPAKIFWLMEQGILIVSNNIFTEDTKDAENQVVDNGDGTQSQELHVYLTPENIIKGKFIIFDANIFRDLNAVEDEDEYFDDGEVGGSSILEGKKVLRTTIAGWYYAIRNFSIVALLTVLLYVGIRMILSTISSDKAKYKTMFKDWLVALCLVVFMHAMMITVLKVSSMITEALGGGSSSDMVGRISEIIQGVLSNNEDDENPYTYVTNDRNTGNEKTYTISDAYAYILVMGRNNAIYNYICSKIFKKGIYNYIPDFTGTSVLYYVSDRQNWRWKSTGI